MWGTKPVLSGLLFSLFQYYQHIGYTLMNLISFIFYVRHSSLAAVTPFKHEHDETDITNCLLPSESSMTEKLTDWVFSNPHSRTTHEDASFICLVFILKLVLEAAPSEIIHTKHTSASTDALFMTVVYNTTTHFTSQALENKGRKVYTCKKAGDTNWHSTCRYGCYNVFTVFMNAAKQVLNLKWPPWNMYRK